MEITIKDLTEKNGKESFTVCCQGIEIKQCKVVDGAKGPFVSGPAIPPKQDGGKWFNVVYFEPAASNKIIQILRGARVPEIDVMADVLADVDDQESIPF